MSSKKDFPVKINPELLVWARLNEGLDRYQAALMLGIQDFDLERYETGAKQPSAKFLQKCAEVYRRPLAAFLLPKPPKQFRAQPTKIIIKYDDGTSKEFEIKND